MAPTGRARRRLLTPREAGKIGDGLRRGRIHRVEDLAFPPDVPLSIRTMRDVEFRNCSLWLNVGDRFLGVRRGLMEGCSFRGVQLEALRIWKTDVRSVEFEGVMTGFENLGGIDDSTLEAVSFRDCRLNDYAFAKSTLSGVSFVGGSLQARVSSCHLTDVDIASEVSDTLFLDCTFANTDLSGSEAQDVTFLDWRSTDVRLPRGRAGFFVTAADLEAVARPLLAELSIPVRERMTERVLDIAVSPVAISERFLRSVVGASASEASLLVDALLPRRLASLSEIDASDKASHGPQ